MLSKNSLKIQHSLPVYKYEKEIISTLNKSHTMIIIGETGSGKTTQIPQIIMKSLNLNNKAICITQPRRVAAISVAVRVAKEVGCPIGGTVGYAVRFAERHSEKTKIKYVTDGMLVRECIIDPLLSKYSVIIIDEVHERSISSDILLAVVKELIISKKRPDLKLVIMSATLDTSKYSSYLNTRNVLTIHGRTFPIQVYNVVDEQKTYIDATYSCIMQIHLYEKELSNYTNGDILAFLPGQEDIEDLMDLLNSKKSKLPHDKQYVILPLFSAIPNEEQMKIFQPLEDKNKRKIILSTNIAETSITIKNIKYVIDCGYFKIRNYIPKLGLETLTISKISKNSAIQRAGRAGRESQGKCFRLYTEKEFDELVEYTTPEILRVNLKNVVLDLLSIGIENIFDFDFIDKPSRESYLKAFEDLITFKAVDKQFKLTEVGKKMSVLPVEPMYALILINSLDAAYDLVRDEILTIVSILQSDNIFYTPSAIKEKVEKVRERFIHPYSDHLTLLNVFLQWKESKHEGRANNSLSFAKEHYLNDKALQKAEDIKKQLQGYLNKIQAKSMTQEETKERNINKVEQLIETIESSNRYTQNGLDDSIKEDLIIKCLMTGYFDNLARYTNDNYFMTIKSKTNCKVHPSSVLIKQPKLGKTREFLFFNEIIVTNKQYLKCCTLVREELVKKYLKSAI